MTDPVLVACSHGTRSPAGRAVIEQFRAEIAAARPGLRIEAAHVDVEEPFVGDVVNRLRDEGASLVVVPLLLSTGFHVKTDIGRAVASAPGQARAAAPLGPDPLLIQALQDRLTDAAPDDVIVLAAAGSSDPAASEAVQQTAAALSAARNGADVSVGYAAAGAPTVADAVAAARKAHPGRQVTVACYLLAPGQFVTRLNEAGADRVTAPLAPHPALVELALRRYDEAR
ncbi:sirohydrochlorin chelatase [Kineosporia babensis]|uniref:Sirohydrochlorin chelatase n=1 Tax=Kineosporia babensis TaxID=499548 RepID=A0A9X1SVK2_9ACTN|nr:CbiX/SirB N-terminal domain-containing protein [Kineosporia babensis]MCD5313721.1 sirohydrochlorin chelatase [Kineosporia babensis]